MSALKVGTMGCWGYGHGICSQGLVLAGERGSEGSALYVTHTGSSFV